MTVDDTNVFCIFLSCYDLLSNTWRMHCTDLVSTCGSQVNHGVMGVKCFDSAVFLTGGLC